MLKLIIKSLNNSRIRRINKLKGPTNLMFFVTNRCNANCPHCFYWKNLNKNTDELSIKEIEKSANSLENCNSVGLTGGEPTLREDLLDICRIFLNKVDSLTLASNGLLPEVMYSVLNLKDISGNQKKKIYLQLSIDGLKNTQESIRGHRSFDKVIETIELIKDLKNVKIVLVTTISKLNKDELDGIVFFFSKYKLEHRFNITRGIDNSLFNLKENLINYHNPKEPHKVFLSIEEIEEAYNKLLDLNKRYNFWTKHDQAVMMYSIRILKEKKKILNCFAGKLEGVLYPNGDVSFCEFLKPFDNIRNFNYDFHKLWNSPKAQRYRKFINDCYCIHSCNISMALNYDPDFIYENIKDKNLFQKAKIILNYFREILYNILTDAHLYHTARKIKRWIVGLRKDTP